METSERHMAHASLFSGIGGPEIAAEMMGWTNLFHCEINHFGRKILDYWFPKSISYEDVKRTDFFGWRGKVNVLTAGFPCQPFSSAGKRKGADDDRYLWPEVVRVVRQVQPDWVVGENVAGILTMVQPGSETNMESEGTLFGKGDGERISIRQQYVTETVCSDLEREGYSVQPVLVPACAVGAPHRRDRVFFIARRTAADSENNGRRTWGKEECGMQERVVPLCECEGDEVRCATGRFGVNRSSADTDSIGQQRWMHEVESEAADASDSARYARGLWDTWKDFPTQSPVCGGDDGFPFYVDRLAIPFEKWRKESLKAYGNAIVPQVMYEIFRAIEKCGT